MVVVVVGGGGGRGDPRNLEERLIISFSHISKHLSTLSDINRSIHSCSRASNWMSLSSPCPRASHSNSVSGSSSAITAQEEALEEGVESY